MNITGSVPLTVEEAAQILKVSKYTVYELIKRGEIPVQRVGRQIRIDPKDLYPKLQGAPSDNLRKSFLQEKSDQANQTESMNEVPQEGLTSLHFVGSHDPAVELLAELLKNSPLSLSFSFEGSMNGLLALYRRQAGVSGIHLWDDKTGEYNLPFVHYVLPGESVTLVNLVQRVQGLMVQPGNPLEIRSWEDLHKDGVRFINRQKGSGTRLRLDAELRERQISPARIQGYEHEEQTHFGVASRIASGQADVGIGVQSAAHRMGLDFIPLFSERYDLVFLNETQSKIRETIFSVLNSQTFQIALQRQVGYDTSLTGKVIYQTEA